MQLLCPAFLERFPGAVINVHPALLPAFPGLRAVEQALAYGVKVFGVTVHFVDEGVDSGPVILQRALELPDAQSRDEVIERLQPIEHELLPEAVRLIARGAVQDRSGEPTTRHRRAVESRARWSRAPSLRSSRVAYSAPGEVQASRVRCCRFPTRPGIVDSPAGWSSSGSRSSPPAARRGS